jgi:hypothetical protein
MNFGARRCRYLAPDELAVIGFVVIITAADLAEFR